jgi:hypothetical protein
VGHVVRFGASVVQNIDTLFFMLLWAQGGSQKMCDGACCAKHVFLHLVRSTNHVLHSGHETSMHYFSCSGGPSVDPIKACQDTLCRTCFLHLV